VSGATRTDRTPRRFQVDEDLLALAPAALERAFGPSVFFWDDQGDEPDEFDRVGSVAVVSIDGPLTQRGGWWWDGYESIQRRLAAALADPKTTSVLLRINSPGGVCAGCFEAARSMRAAVDASGKPCVAYADEAAYSAAYALASVADQIVLPPSGGVGSVGVIATYYDRTQMNAELGVNVQVLKSGAQKADGHPDVKLTNPVLERLQARVDQLAGMFAALVGERRSMTVDTVAALEAACLYGPDAVAKGLADQVGNLQDALALAASLAETNQRNATMKQMFAALGLPEDATETQAVAKITSLSERAARADELSRENAALGKAADESKKKVLIEQARRAGKLTPAIEAKESWQRIAAGPVDALSGALDVMEPQIPAAVTQSKESPLQEGGAVTLTAEERRTAKSLRLTEAEMLETKKRRLAAQKENG
jgi:signal peptide peptidase SppA